jgi:hypothetical protein
MLTFKEVVDAVSPELGSGFDSSSERARRTIRSAIGQLLESYPVMLTKKIRLQVAGNVAVFPESVRRIKNYWMGGIVSRPQSINYEFLENGPGVVDVSVATHTVLIDLGFTPVSYQPSACLPVTVFSDRNDEGGTITIQGLDDNDKIVRSDNGTLGETIQFGSGNTEIVSRLSFKTITSVVKTKTKGYVNLYSFDAANDARYVLARYSPDTTVAQMRQYRLPGNRYLTDGTPQWTELIANVILNKPTLLNDTDIVPINNMTSIEFMARSIELHRLHKYKESQVESQTALGILKQHVMLEYPSDQTIDIQGACFMHGDVQTL